MIMISSEQTTCNAYVRAFIWVLLVKKYSLITEKSKESAGHPFRFTDYAKAFDCGGSQ